MIGINGIVRFGEIGRWSRWPGSRNRASLGGGWIIQKRLSILLTSLSLSLSLDYAKRPLRLGRAIWNYFLCRPRNSLLARVSRRAAWETRGRMRWFRGNCKFGLKKRKDMDKIRNAKFNISYLRKEKRLESRWNVPPSAVFYPLKIKRDENYTCRLSRTSILYAQ